MADTQHTEIGVFPSHWEVTQIGQLIQDKIILGHLDGNHGNDYPRAEEFADTGVPYISANSIVQGKVDFSKAKFLTHQRANSLRKGRAKDGDVLFAHNATVGPVALLMTSEPIVILSTTLTFYRTNEEYLHNKYLKMFLESELFVRQYTPLMAQSTRNQVPITAQRKFFVALPPLSEQRKIAAILGTWDAAIATAERLVAALRARKRALMQRLLTGQVRVAVENDAG